MKLALSLPQPLFDQGRAIDEAAHKAATSPFNTLVPPSISAKEAGLYTKGRIIYHGLKLVFEQPAGSIRRGIGGDGKEWSNVVAHHYGYVDGLMGDDGEPLDFFMGPNHESPWVFIVAQKDRNGKYDESKVLFGFNTRREARKGYLECYPPNWDRIQSIKRVAFDQWLEQQQATKKSLLALPILL